MVKNTYECYFGYKVGDQDKKMGSSCLLYLLCYNSTWMA